MKCNNCDAELEEGVTLCPSCGCDNAEAETEVLAEETKLLTDEPQPEKPVEEPTEPTPIVEGKLTPGKIALLVVLAVAAIAVVVALIMGGLSGGNEATEPTEATVLESVDPSMETTPDPTVPADGNPDDVTCKGSYTDSDEEVLAARETVVATLGDAVLTNGELQIHYWMQFYDFLNAYGSYASMLGMDYTQPLDTQLSPDGTLTWQQYLLSGALDAWRSYEALAMDAEKAGFQMDESYVTFLNTLTDTMEQQAASAGFESAQKMLEADMGVGCSMDDYMLYMEDYYMGYLYYLSLVEKLEVTPEEVEAYYDENAATFAESGVEKDDQKYVDVRHILIMPQGGTTAEDGTTTYSEEEWETCRATAQAILDEYLAGDADEKRFAELANANSEDGGSNTNGGRYENVYVGQMVEPFEQWCFDETRQLGDTGLVRTNYGYHVMYFVGSENVWYASAKEELLSNMQAEILADAMDNYELSIDYSAIKLGFVNFAPAG